MAELRRLLQRAADSERDAFDPMLVPVHPRHGFAPDLAKAVESVGAKGGVEGELVVYGMHAKGMVRAREHDPLDTVAASTFVDLEESLEVVLADLRKGPLDAGAGHMNQDVDTVQEAVDDGRVAKVAVRHVFCGRERLQWFGTTGRTKIDTPFEQFRP